MKHSSKLGNTVHIIAFININSNFDLNHAATAKSVHTNPSYIRQLRKIY